MGRNCEVSKRSYADGDVLSVEPTGYFEPLDRLRFSVYVKASA